MLDQNKSCVSYFFRLSFPKKTLNDEEILMPALPSDIST